MSEGKVKAFVLSRDATLQERALIRAGPLLIDEKEEVLYTAPPLIRGRRVLLSDERGAPVRLPWQSEEDVSVSHSEIDDIMASRFGEIRLGEASLGRGTLTALKMMGVVQIALVGVVGFLGVAFGMPKLLEII